MTPKALFTTERLVVRPWTLDPLDLAWAHRIYSDPEVVKTIGGRVMPTLSATREHMQMRLERQQMWRGAYGAWAIERQEDGVVVGTALMKPLKANTDVPIANPNLRPELRGPWTDDIEIGWHLARPDWGCGYATEIGRGLIELARGRGLSEVLAVVEASNHRSQQVALRAGMTPRGETTKYYDGLRLSLFGHRFV